MILIAPSLLAADFRDLRSEIAKIEAGGANSLHCDIMDGHFVPNISMGPFIIKWVRQITQLPLDIHLMLSRPDDYIEAFAKAGADRITIHVESEGNTADTIRRIRDAGKGAGLALNPDTPAKEALPFLENVDMVLAMTVYPGFGGQSFMESVMPKIEVVRKAAGDDYLVQVDGGIDENTIKTAAGAGANVIVAGTSIFRAEDPARAIKELRTRAQSAFNARKASN